MMEQAPTDIKLYGTATDSIVDGPGLRFSVFTQGCPHACPGCHNPESQPFDSGYMSDIETLVAEICANKLIQGVTLSGGEPLAQSAACLRLARELKEKGFNLWIYSGYLYEDIMAGNVGPEAAELIALCDVLVDGPFVEELHSYDLLWKGSSNQRVIDIAQSAAKGEVVLWENEEDFPEPPSSW